MSATVLKIANAPVSWGILEVGEWGKTPYNVFLDDLVQLEYEGTELGPFGYFPTDPHILSTELQARQLALAGAFVPVLFTHWNAGELERVAELGKYLKDAGAQHIILSDGGEPGRRSLEEQSNFAKGLTDGEWAVMGAALAEIRDVCRNIGLKVEFHHHVGSFVESPEEIERMLDITEPIGIQLCLDTGHLIWADGDLIPFVRQYAHRIGHLHLKDIHAERIRRAKDLQLDFVSAVKSGIFVPLGTGSVDFRVVFEILDQANYEGWVVVEQDRIGDDVPPGFPTPYDSARESRAYLERLRQPSE